MAATDTPLRTVVLDALGDRLSRLRLCKPNACEHMRRSLERRGQLTAVTAFDDGEQLQLVDGFKRLRAAGRLGWSCLRVRVLDHDEATAIATIVALHDHRGLSELEEGWIVHWLCREHGLSQGAVGQMMSRHKSWVSRRLLLVEGLAAEVQIDVRLGLLSARSALAVAALPRGNQLRAAELVVARGMTTRQTEALVRRLQQLDSDEERAAQLTHWPEPGADTCPERGRGRPRSNAEQLLADVAALMRLVVRVEVHLLAAPLGADGPQVLRGALDDLAAQLGTLDAAIGRALSLQDKVDAATLAQS